MYDILIVNYINVCYSIYFILIHRYPHVVYKCATRNL